MRRMIVVSIVFFGAIWAAIAGVRMFWRGETLADSKVCERWGDTPFDAKKFKDSESEQIRAKMACSLLKNQKTFIGKDRSDIRKELGDFDGFYFSDMFPAYMIHSATTRTEDSWQIVFLIDRKEAVSKVVVHKNCCDR